MVLNMAEEIQSVISHVSLGTNDFDRATAFYDAVLSTLGMKRILEIPNASAIAYGRQFPEFWIQRPGDGNPATIGNGSHISFIAESQEAVIEFHKTALAAGATDDGAPGPRPHYGEPYFGCFLRDLDGHKIEATFWDLTKAQV